jgi:hypothetical protein
MSRKIVFVFMAFAITMAGCQGESAGQFARTHEAGLIGGAAGAGIGGIVGHAVGRNTTGTLLGAGVGAGLGYLLGNQFDQKRAQQKDVGQSADLVGTNWQVVRLNVPNSPEYRAMYLSFEPDNSLITTTILPDGRVVKAVETYRISDHTLIINKPGQGNQPGYIINAPYTRTANAMTLNSPDFSATLVPVQQVPAATS